LAKLEEKYGLNDHIMVQYFDNLVRLLHGDLTISYKYEGRLVSDIIGDSLPISASIGLIALTMALAIGIPIGVIAAVKKNSTLDYMPMSLSMVGICLPTFVLGPILALVFGIKLNWFNANGWYDASDWFLPSLTLGLYYAAYIARLARGGMLEILNQDFIRTARAKGLPGHKIVLKHALKGGLLPVVAYLGPAFAGLISGSFVIEKVFNIPGMGQHFVDAAFNGDYFLVQGTVIVYGTAIVLLNLAVDFVQILLNPRLTFQGS
ncbi:MAG: ABC transporter permease, partial [Verrucomicrobiales bacterium]|nr:ABC transporter permease [Verrucomicrobiales bacterium]